MGMNGNLKAGNLAKSPAFNRQVTLPHFTSHIVTPRMTDPLGNYPYPLPRVDTPEALCTTSPSPEAQIVQTKVGTWPPVIHSDSSPAQSFGIQMEITSPVWISLKCRDYQVSAFFPSGLLRAEDGE